MKSIYFSFRQTTEGDLCFFNIEVSLKEIDFIVSINLNLLDLNGGSSKDKSITDGDLTRQGHKT